MQAVPWPRGSAISHRSEPYCIQRLKAARVMKTGRGISRVLHPCTDDQIRRFVDALTHFGIGVSWGGYESLVLPVKPVRVATPWREDGQLVRFNIGLETLESLQADLAAALPHLNS